MLQRKNVLFTFDYELFLGKRSGSVHSCVIEPTERLLNIFSDYRISSAIFFIDTLWLCRLKEASSSNTSAKEDYEKVAQQLKQISKLGHYLFPHLHPHWLDADYLPEINQWQLINYSRYRFNNLNPIERNKCFEESLAILKDILGAEYAPNGYRAGGWSIQPFEDFAPYFQKHNMLYDFSVLPGKKHISTGQQYDFSDIKVTHPYTFSIDVTVPGKGNYIEFPISVVRISNIRNILNRIHLKYLSWGGDRSYGNGQGITTEIIEAENGDKNEMVSIELLSTIKLPVYLKFIKKNSYMQFIAHPKMLTNHNINTFIKFLGKACNTYNLETDFTKIGANK